MAFRWIHISGFHFLDSNPYDGNSVLKGLLAEIERRRQAGFQTDALFATEYIAFSGQACE
jgi:hypothetical protein